MKLIVENKVFGSLTNVQGDGVLAYSSGISAAADSFGSLLTGTPQSPLSDQYASIYFLQNPDNGLNTILHVQGNYTVFSGMARAYDTRCVYEVSPQQFALINYRYTPLIAALDRMHRYNQHEYGVPNQLEIDDAATPALSPAEQWLHRMLVHSLVSGKRIFIKLGEGDRLTGDDIRRSPKLATLTHAIDSLPLAIRPYVSMGYSVDAASAASRALIAHLLVVAHHDDVQQWGPAAQGHITIDWSTDQLQCNYTLPAQDVELARLQCIAPLIGPFTGGKPCTLKQVLGLFSLIPQNIDRVLNNKVALTNNEKMILDAVFQGGPESYHHREVCHRLLVFNCQSRTHNDKQQSQILHYYPEYGNEPQLRDYLQRRLLQIVNAREMNDFYEMYQMIPGIEDLIMGRLTKSSQYLDDVAMHPDLPVSRHMQENIVQLMKKQNNKLKVSRMHIPYYNIHIDDIVVDDWDSYAHVQDLINQNNRTEKREIEIKTKEWGLRGMTPDIYRKVRSRLTRADQLDLLNLAIRENPDLFLLMMDSNPALLNEDIKYRIQYIALRCRQMALSRVNPDFIGKGDVLDVRLIDALERIDFFRRQGMFMDAVTMYSRHNRLDDTVKQRLLQVADTISQNISLTTYVMNVVKLYALIPQYATTKRLLATRSLGSLEQLNTQIEALRRMDGTASLVSEIEKHRQKLLVASAPKNTEELIRELKTVPLIEEHFQCFQKPEDVTHVMQGLDINAFGQLYTAIQLAQSELARIQKRQLFQNTLNQLAQNFLSEWFKTKDVTKCIFVKRISPLRNKEYVKFILSCMKDMDANVLAEMQDNFTLYYNKRHRNKEEFRNNRKLLRPATTELVRALTARHMLMEDSPLPRYCSKAGLPSHRSPWRRLSRNARLAILITAAVLIVGNIIAGILLWPKHEPSKPAPKPAPRVVLTDSLRQDSLRQDSLRRDSLHRDSLRLDSIHRLQQAEDPKH